MLSASCPSLGLMSATSKPARNVEASGSPVLLLLAASVDDELLPSPEDTLEDPVDDVLPFEVLLELEASTVVEVVLGSATVEEPSAFWTPPPSSDPHPAAATATIQHKPIIRIADHVATECGEGTRSRAPRGMHKWCGDPATQKSAHLPWWAMRALLSFIVRRARPDVAGGADHRAVASLTLPRGSPCLTRSFRSTSAPG